MKGIPSRVKGSTVRIPFTICLDGAVLMTGLRECSAKTQFPTAGAWSSLFACEAFCVEQEMMFAAALRNASALRLKGVRYAAEFSGRARVRSRPTLRHAAPPHSTLALRHTRFNWRS